MPVTRISSPIAATAMCSVAVALGATACNKVFEANRSPADLALPDAAPEMPDAPPEFTCADGAPSNQGTPPELCQTYEEDGIPGTISCPNGRVSVATLDGAKGRKGLRISYADGDAATCGVQGNLSSTEEVWVRSWVRPLGNAGYSNVLVLWLNDDTTLQVSRGPVGTYLRAGEYREDVQATHIPPHAWTCLELHATVRNGMAQLEFYSRGKLRMQGTSAVSPAAALKRVSLGWYADSTLQQYELQFDDTAVSATRIPCNENE